MPRKHLKEVNKRIKAKLDELADDRAERDRAWKIIRNTSAKVSDLRDELHKARKRAQRRRAVVATVKEDLAELEAETPDEDTPEEIELRERLDQLSGEYDEAVADRDRILDRLDRLQDKQADARAVLQKAVDESKEDQEALTRLRKRRKKIQDRQDRPSPNFAYAEFDCNDGTDLPEQSEPAVKDWCERIGEPLRKRFGSVHINSGFRHRAYNARIGGETNSVHIYDYPGRNYKAVAVDFKCGKGTVADWYAFTAGKADGRGRYSTFHHADTRNRIGWPDATWSG